MIRRTPLVAAALATLTLAAQAAAQDPAQIKPFTLEVEVDLVSVTAVVFDKRGTFIRDLGTDDIQIGHYATVAGEETGA